MVVVVVEVVVVVTVVVVVVVAVAVVAEHVKVTITKMAVIKEVNVFVAPSRHIHGILTTAMVVAVAVVVFSKRGNISSAAGGGVAGPCALSGNQARAGEVPIPGVWLATAPPVTG